MAVSSELVFAKPLVALLALEDVLKAWWTHFAGLAGARDPFRASWLHKVLTWPWVGKGRCGAEGLSVLNYCGNGSLRSVGCENEVAPFLFGGPVLCGAVGLGWLLEGDPSRPACPRAPRGESGERQRCELRLVASGTTLFKPSGFASESVCWADGRGSGGRVGAGAEGREGGSGFGPGLWRSCPLRVGWRP